MLKSAIPLRILNSSMPLDPDALDSVLQSHRFVDPGALEAESFGFVRPFDGAASHDLAHHVDAGEGRSILVLTMRHDKKSIPASALARLVKKRASEIEQEQGHKPGKRQMREIKERMIDELMPKQLAKTSVVSAYLIGDLLMIDTSSTSAFDKFVGAMYRAIGDLKAVTIKTMHAPGAVMSGWLSDGNEPDGYFIGKGARMVGPDAQMVTLKGIGNLPDEVAKHIASGLTVDRLDLEADQAKFTLDSYGPSLLGIKWQDGMLRQEQYHQGDGDSSAGMMRDTDIMLDVLFARGIVERAISQFGGEVSHDETSEEAAA